MEGIIAGMVLRSKKTLKRRTALKRGTSRKTMSQAKKPRSGNKTRVGHKKTLPELVRAADEAFSKYVRLRDSSLMSNKQWVGDCISCGRHMVVVWWDAEKRKYRWTKGVNAGHYIGRSKHFLRWDEANVNLQCARCNGFDDQVGVLKNYRRNLCMKVGDDMVLQLEIWARNTHKPGRAELDEIISVSKGYVKERLNPVLQ